MPREVTSDGRVLEWTGHSISYCVHCEELFASITAFDYHLKRGTKGGDARHDITGMPRNHRGHLVVSLRDSKPAEKRGAEHSE